LVTMCSSNRVSRCASAKHVGNVMRNSLSIAYREFTTLFGIQQRDAYTSVGGERSETKENPFLSCNCDWFTLNIGRAAVLF